MTTTEEIYNSYMTQTNKLLNEENNPLEIAGVMLAQALSIYKTVLNEEDFEGLLNHVLDSRDKVQKLLITEPQHVH
jgi:hypothetical protein